MADGKVTGRLAGQGEMSARLSIPTVSITNDPMLVTVSIADDDSYLADFSATEIKNAAESGRLVYLQFPLFVALVIVKVTAIYAFHDGSFAVFFVIGADGIYSIKVSNDKSVSMETVFSYS